MTLLHYNKILQIFFTKILKNYYFSVIYMHVEVLTFFDCQAIEQRAKGLPRQSKKNEVKVLGCVYINSYFM